MKRILFVDDDITLGNAVIRYLENRGYSVLGAANGIEGLQIFEQNMPDLVISDVMMSEMDGFEFCRRLRATRAGQLVPFIFLSSRKEVDDRIQGHQIGADDYLVKPFEPKELVAKIEAQLERSRRIHSEIYRVSLSRDEDIAPLQAKNDYLETQLENLLEKNKQLRSQLETSCKADSNSQNYDDIDNTEDQLKNVLESNALSVVGIFSHALKGELMNIANSEKTLRELLELTSEDVCEELNIIKRSAGNSILHVRRLVELLQVGGIQNREILVSEVLSQFINLTRLPSRVQLKLDMEEDIESCKIAVDLEQLVLVLNELVINSVKALGNRRGTVEVSVKKCKGQLSISVKDDGPGIPDEILSVLFEEQVPSRNGSGLGLKLCQRIIMQLKGELKLVSSSIQGTVISILLPLVE